jgi:phosphatidylserine/phosphatidylglycerophosphate/cardiolipin synthase-like enzyme
MRAVLATYGGGGAALDRRSHASRERRGLLHGAVRHLKDTREVLLAKHPFAVYALLDKADNNMELLRASPDTHVTAGAYLGDGPWHQFLMEALTGLNKAVQFIHTNYVLVDPFSEDPLVITGSANLSGASVSANDENLLIIRGSTRVADIYVTEFMRLFTHMYFRQHVAKALGADTSASRSAGHKGAGAQMANLRTPSPHEPAATDELFLCPDDSWTTEWFTPGTDKCRERELFA